MKITLPKLIMAADKAIRELYQEIINQLSQDDTDYSIEFMGQTFDFCTPLDRDEKEKMEAAKKVLAKLFFKDAFEKLLDHIDMHVSQEDQQTWHEYRRTWFNIVRLQREVPRSTIENINQSCAYEVDESKSKALDYESIYIQAQRKDLTDEEKWNILLHNLTVQESNNREQS